MSLLSRNEVLETVDVDKLKPRRPKKLTKADPHLLDVTALRNRHVSACFDCKCQPKERVKHRLSRTRLSDKTELKITGIDWIH
ncbi:hypothetical protein Trydic_g18568 [Trypoxylus dichotomus]